MELESIMKVWYRLIPPFLIALMLDGLTKIWALQNLEPFQPVPVIGEFFRLTLGYNTGVAFGLFANGGIWPLIVTGIVILALMFWLTNALRRGDFPAMAAWPMGFLLGGAVANFADRLIDGQVVDFLDVGLGTMRWPTFNIADSFIVLSLVTLMIMSLKSDQAKQAKNDKQRDESLSETESL
jgi:signal peptidase II